MVCLPLQLVLHEADARGWPAVRSLMMPPTHSPRTASGWLTSAAAPRRRSACRGGPLPQDVLLGLAGRRHGEPVDERPGHRDLVRGDLVPEELGELGGRRPGDQRERRDIRGLTGFGLHL